jgi:hypothetical protein
MTKTPAEKAAPKSPAAVKKSRSKAKPAGHPDVRYGVYGDPDHETLCKWINDWNEYQCKIVPKGGDWTA